MKKLMLVLIASACCSAFAQNASAQADKAIADAVIAMTKAQWAAGMKDPTNVAEQSKDMSDDYTEFNGDFATRVDGKAMNMHLAEGVAKDSSKGTAAEMLNEKVQVYNGDVAILTYNYAGTTHRQGRQDDPESGQINPRLREEGREMGDGSRQLRVRSVAEISS